MKRVYIGFDSREVNAWNVCVRSMIENTDEPLQIVPISSTLLRADGIYTRPEKTVDGRRFDEISAISVSSEFSIARFMVPHLAGRKGWAMFCDCDFMFLNDVRRLFELADDRFGVMVVKHDHRPRETVKMDGQPQYAYPRKNWSSLMLFNLEHPQVQELTPGIVNSLTGAALHRFTWIDDGAIGELPITWNYLEGYSGTTGEELNALHYTRGTPDMPGYENAFLASQWWQYAKR